MAAGYSKFGTNVSNECLLKYYSIEGMNRVILRFSSFINEGSKFTSPKITRSYLHLESHVPHHIIKVQVG